MIAIFRGGLNIPSGNGKTLIIDHIGVEGSFISRCTEYFVGKKISSNHNQEVKHISFEGWWGDDDNSRKRRILSQASSE